jgi:hypothetical protein
MQYLKKFINANSILESVLALTIISICMFIAVMVYATVFNSKNSLAAHLNEAQMQEMYFLMQVRPDSLLQALPKGFDIETGIEGRSRMCKIKYTGDEYRKMDCTYYLPDHE